MAERERKSRDQNKLITLLLRWVINAVAIAAAIYLIPGLSVAEGGGTTYLLIALIFGFVNAIIRPIVLLLTCPLLILTLGLGTLLVNAGLFALTAWFSQQVGLGFSIDGFWAAFFGALVVTIVSAVLSGLLGVRDE
jgi:putative membrane protein